MKDKPANIHHLVPKSRKGEGFDVQSETNLVLMDEKFHENIHRVFSNLTPREQMIFLYEVNKRVISSNSGKEILEVLLKSKEEFYNKNILK